MGHPSLPLLPSGEVLEKLLGSPLRGGPGVCGGNLLTATTTSLGGWPQHYPKPGQALDRPQTPPTMAGAKGGRQRHPASLITASASRKQEGRAGGEGGGAQERSLLRCMAGSPDRARPDGFPQHRVVSPRWTDMRSRLSSPEPHGHEVAPHQARGLKSKSQRSKADLWGLHARASHPARPLCSWDQIQAQTPKAQLGRNPRSRARETGRPPGARSSSHSSVQLAWCPPALTQGGLTQLREEERQGGLCPEGRMHAESPLGRRREAGGQATLLCATNQALCPVRFPFSRHSSQSVPPEKTPSWEGGLCGSQSH